MKYLRLFCMCFAIVFFINTYPFRFETHTTLYIWTDYGGDLQERHEEIQSLVRQNKRVIINGYCASACTLYLVMPTTCITTKTILAFHGPSYEDGTPLKGGEFEVVTHAMAKYYPPKIASMFMSTARHLFNDDLYEIGYKQAVEMGVKPC